MENAIRVETMEKWNRFAVKMSAHGYGLCVFQHDYDDPEGFHAWFEAPDMPNVEIVTHNQDVNEAILHFHTGFSL